MTVVLDLVVDATGVQRGGQQAETALKGVQDAAAKTQTSVTNVGSSLSKTFQATQGGVQIATGIAQTAQAFQSLNLAAAGFVGARVLLEIGQTAQQLTALRGGATAATGVIAALGRSVPYVGLALSAAAAAMALFGDNTRKTASAFDGLAASMQKARLSDETARFLGAQPGSPASEMQRLFDVANQLRREGPGTASQPRTYSLAEIQEFVGAPSRGGLATEFGIRPPPRGVPGFENFDIGAVQIPQEDVLNWVRQRYQRLANPSQGGTAYDVAQARGMSRSWAAAEQANTNKAREDAARIAESMERAARAAEQIGGAFGAAAFDVLAGVTSLRQAVLSLVGSLARQGFSNLGSTLFGATVRQVQGNTNPTPGGINEPQPIP